MKLLLDTHCWLWWLAEPENLSQEILDAISDPHNTVYLSAVSSWEITVKHKLGKLPLPEAPRTFVLSRLARDRLEPLAVSHTHALGVSELPPHHRDPFDRLLISQTLAENATLVTADRDVLRYDVTVLSP